jgi:hypothetical protein
LVALSGVDSAERSFKPRAPSAKAQSESQDNGFLSTDVQIGFPSPANKHSATKGIRKRVVVSAHNQC